MVTPSGSCPLGSPAAAALGASENGFYVDLAHARVSEAAFVPRGWRPLLGSGASRCEALAVPRAPARPFVRGVRDPAG